MADHEYWWPISLTSGVYRGRTVGWVYARDQGYLFKFTDVTNPIEQGALRAAAARKERVDTWADDGQLLELGRG
jgi:hypothetical protein